MLAVGLTGGIGSGKSTVAKAFESHGITVIDADRIAHELMQPNTDATQKIITHFGNSVQSASNTLDRAALRTKVYDDPQARAWLEALLHPLIREAMQQQRQQANSPYCVLMIPLLIENKRFQTVDRILVVDVPETLQIQRAMARDNLDETTIRAIMAAQVSREARLSNADDVITNTGSLDDLKDAVLVLHQKYSEMTQNPV